MLENGAELTYAVIACMATAIGFILKYIWGVIMGIDDKYATKDQLKSVELSVKDAVDALKSEMEKTAERTDERHKQSMKMQAQHHKDLTALLEAVILKDK